MGWCLQPYTLRLVYPASKGDPLAIEAALCGLRIERDLVEVA